MKKAVFNFVVICLAGILTQCGFPEKNVNTNLTNETNQHAKNYTIEDLEGDWTLIKVETIKEKQSIERYKEATDLDAKKEWCLDEVSSSQVFLNEDGVLISTNYDLLYVKNRDLHIHQNIIYWLNYPLQLERKSAFTIESDLITIDSDQEIYQVQLSQDKDTIAISHLGAYGLYSKETYQKVSFNDSILNVVKRYETNLPLFAGKWEVFREGNINNDGTEYELDFPYEIPNVVQITHKELTDVMLKDALYSMLTDGQKRDYSLTYDGDFVLSPLDWLPDNYQGDSNIYLSRLSKERQELSPQDCWVEFLQVITSGDIHYTIDLMTNDGYHSFWKKMPHSEFELKLKHLGQVWQELEIKWSEISKTHATATFGVNGKENHLEFVKLDGLWKIDVLIYED